tara:strand:+ start:458 stop:1348 length:891 start_codon:yes stop_codon:yes gene_type:complete
MNNNLKKEDLRQLINKSLLERIPSESDVGEDLLEAMRYAVMGGGKRIRPIFTLATCESTGASVVSALDAACAIEMIHAYSLIHDDLPAMDDDDTRHGQASAHIAFGEAQAILAGDALQSLAFQLISESEQLTDPVKVSIVRVLSSAIGYSGMAGGQSMDIRTEQLRISDSDLKLLHQAKTGALIKASIEIGALVSERVKPSSKEFDVLSTFGSSVGLAFQIVDDLIDVTSTSKELGKPANSDQKNQKQTFVDVLGLENSKKLSNEIIEEAIALLDTTDLQGELLKSLALDCVNRTR